MKGFFLSIEGIEGVGKSTIVQYIEKYLLSIQQDFILTREPGGTPLAEKIRHLLLSVDHTEKMAAETEVLLMFAARKQHIQEVIMPALTAGKWVVSDRYVDASYAYQGGGRKIGYAHIEMLEKWIVGQVKPDMTILLDASPRVGLERAKHRGPQDRIEQEKMDFFERVREGYLQRMASDRSRFCLIDATQPLIEVQAKVKSALESVGVKK